MSSMLPGMGGDFAKGVSGAGAVYDTSPAGLGVSPSYLAGGATASSSSSSGATELGYTEFTANVSITALTSGTANTVVTAPAIAVDGVTAIIVSCALPGLVKGTTVIVAELYDGSTSLGVVASSTSSAGTQEFFKQRRLTPSAGSHTYSVKAYVDAGTGVVQSGVGGATVAMPGFIRVTAAG